MRRRSAWSTLAAGVALLVVAGAAFYTAGVDRRTAAMSAAEVDTTPVDPLTIVIESAQRRLADVPGDWRTWAELGAAYVEQARATADPSFYGKAEGALVESLAIRPEGNDLALTGQGALANARHEFRAAADLASRALDINPYSAAAWGVLTDARTQLGDYAGARQALDEMLRLQPGVASFTRASYDAELHGRLPDAVSALEQALDRSETPGEEAFCRTYLAMLAFAAGDLETAEAHVTAGLTEVPGHPELRLAQARVQAAHGDEEAAIESYRAVVAAWPLPEHLVEFGEYLLSVGRTSEAGDQFALLSTVRQLFEANGVRDDLGVAQFAADHGDPADAVAAAQEEFDSRQNVDSHDALAWALHSAGRDAEALPHAHQATALGGAAAVHLYHRGVIEAALGQVDQARASLSRALDTNPFFSPLHAPRAEELLASLGGRP